jgi:hypothetical protein
MSTSVQRLGWSAALLLLLAPALPATTVPRLTFEQLTDASDLIASGKVTQSWAAWDSEHKYIWTHYLLSVSDTAKGNRVTTVEFAEPGGALGGSTMSIAGSVTYSIGDTVVVFLSRMPNGYLRTTGWSQGKYGLDSAGRVHSTTTFGAETVDLKAAPPASVPLTSLEGMSLSELKQRISARVRATTGRVQ